jgi:virginiamycin B lyase
LSNLGIWLAIAIALTGSVAGCAHAETQTPPRTASFEVTPTASPPAPTATSLVAARSMDEVGASRLAMTVDWMVAVHGFVWAAGEPGIERLNGRTGSVLGTIPVPDGVCLGFDVGFGDIWAAGPPVGSPALLRIDEVTGKLVASIPLRVPSLQCESSVAAGEGAVWVLSRRPNRVLVKVDPKTNKVAATYPMPPEDPFGTHPYATDFGGVRAGYGGVWIADQGKDALLRMSPANGSIMTLIPIGPGSGPRFLALGAGSVWVLNQNDGTVSRIDPETNSVIATITVSTVEIEGGDIAVGCGSVWARVSDQLVARIDPASNQVVARYGPPSGSGGIACDADVLWISAHDVNAIWRVPRP